MVGFTKPDMRSPADEPSDLGDQEQIDTQAAAEKTKWHDKAEFRSLLTLTPRRPTRQGEA